MRATIRYTVSIELASPDDYPLEVHSWREAAEFDEKSIVVESGIDSTVELESITLEGDPESEPFARSEDSNEEA
jgi:hypothetical protein